MADLTIRARWMGTEVDQGISGLIQKLGGVKQILGTLGLVTGIAEAVNVMRSLVADTAEEERIALRLRVTLRNLGMDAERADVAGKLFGELQQKTPFDDGQIAQAFNTLLQGTRNWEASLQALPTVLDLAEAGGIDLASSSAALAKVIEGNNRAVAAMLPSMRSFAESLDSIVDPGERARIMLEEIRRVVGGQAEAAAGTLSGATAQLRNNWSELMQTMLVETGALESVTGFLRDINKEIVEIQKNMTEGPQGTGLGSLDSWLNGPVTDWFLKNGLISVDPRKVGGPSMLPSGTQSALVGAYGYVSPGNAGRPQYSSPIGPAEKPGWWDLPTIDGLTMPAFGLRQRGMRGGAGSIDREMRDLGGMTADALEESRKRMEESIRQFADVSRQPMREIAMELQQGLMGAFSAARGGWQSLVDYMKDYLANVLGQYITGSLLNALIPGAGLSTGLLGKAFGGGGASFQAQAAGNFSAQMRAMRLG